MTFKVLIADSMSPRAAEVLAASPAVHVDDRSGISSEDLVAAIGDYDGLIVRSRTKVTAQVLAAAGKLRIVGRAGIGVDNIDVTEASRRGVIVENTPSGNAVTTAEHALCLLLSLARHIPQATASMKAGKWEKNKFSGSELLGKTLGVVGLGNIGRIVADRARGLRMNVLGYDPFLGKEAADRLGVELAELDEVFRRADYITVHAPLTSATRGLIGADAFAQMKRGVLIVNAARGGIVDEDALVAALETGVVAGAALDVFVDEPPPAGHPLIAHPHVICTPHLGASTDEAQEKVAVEIAEQFVAFAERQEVRNAVNVAPIAPDKLGKLGPWLELCRKMGSLLGQIGSSYDGLTVEVSGDVGELGATPCANAALVGLLSTFMDFPVNEVNASILARDRGLQVSEVKSPRDVDLASCVGITARRGDERYFVKGTLYHVGDRVEPRIVQIDDFLVETVPRGRILIVKNQDRPGVIGAVGTLLGKHHINVNSLHVGLQNSSGVAIALWNVDAALPPEVVAEVDQHPLIQSATVVEL